MGELNLLTVLKAGKSKSMVLASGEGLGMQPNMVDRQASTHEREGNQLEHILS